MKQAAKSATKQRIGNKGYMAFLPKIPTDEMNQPGPDALGDRMRWARLRGNLTVRELAAAAQMNGSGISRIETGKTDPRVTEIYRIAVVLGVSPSWLILGLGQWDAKEHSCRAK